MGYLRFRRSIRIAPGIQLNLGKRGISTSVGVRGLHETFHISGRRRTSIGIPGSGLSYIAQTGRPSRPRSSGARRSASRPLPRVTRQGPPIPLSSLDPATVLPRPGLFASSAKKHYHEGLIAYIRGDQAAALPLFEQTCAEDPQVLSAQLLAATCALHAGDRDRAIGHLEAVVQAPVALPDAFATKYLPAPRIEASIQVSITSLISATVPWNRAGAVLALAEQYQVAGRLEEAVGLVQQLHAAEPDDPVVRLSLADLLGSEGDFEGVVEVAAPAQNSADVDLATIHLRAKALLELDHRVAAFETYRLALARTAGRSLELLKAIRYDRALAYEETGQSTKAQADFERLYALDPTYRDIKARLAGFAPPESGA
jgi:tetratricopeptide (TPR) repeat protein